MRVKILSGYNGSNKLKGNFVVIFHKIITQ